MITKRVIDIINEGLIGPKERKKTKIPKAVVKKRQEDKRKQSIKKGHRKKPDINS